MRKVLVWIGILLLAGCASKEFVDYERGRQVTDEQLVQWQQEGISKRSLKKRMGAPDKVQGDIWRYHYVFIPVDKTQQSQAIDQVFEFENDQLSGAWFEETTYLPFVNKTSDYASATE